MEKFTIGMQIFLLVFVRALGFFISSPFWGGTILVFRFRIMILIMLTYLLLPMVEHTMHLEHSLTVSIFCLALLENIFYGLLLGFGVYLFFAIFQMVGELWSFQMGFSIGQILDPTTGEQATILSQMMNFLSLIIFISIGGHLKLLFLLYQSFVSNPLIGIFNYMDFFSNLPKGLGTLFLHSLELSLTIVGSIFISTLFIGVLAKAAPQLNVFQFGMPIYIMIGFALLIYFIPNYIIYTGNYVDSMISQIQTWMMSIKGA